MSAKPISSQFESVYLSFLADKTDEHTYLPNDAIESCIPCLPAVGVWAYLQCTCRNEPLDYQKLKQHFKSDDKKISRCVATSFKSWLIN